MTETKMPTPPNQKRSAGQRLTDLEAGLAELYNTFDNLLRDLTLFKEALKLLDNKVSSIIQASARGESLSDDVIDRIMEQNNVDALTEKVKRIVEQGFLVSETEVSENSFIVGKETDAEGKVLNPRVQFALKSLQSPDTQAKLLGAKVGSALNLDGGNVLFTVLESYKIQTPPAPTVESQTTETPPANVSADVDTNQPETVAN